MADDRDPDSWGYCKHNGPHVWSEYASLATEGCCQSPVDITDAVYDDKLSDNRLSYHYRPVPALRILNNGHSFNINYNENDMCLSGGPLSDKYRFAQIHAHWGDTDEAGSEHTINGKQYSAEIHYVHWNSDKYKSIEEAAANKDGLAVLGMFVEIGEEHSTFQQIVDSLPSIQYKHDTTELPEGFDPMQMLPGNTSEYYTYNGSLTTPPCLEAVQFMLFKETIQLSSKQIAELRTLHTHTKDDSNEDEFQGKMLKNYRPTQPINDRVVRKTFE